MVTRMVSGTVLMVWCFVSVVVGHHGNCSVDNDVLTCGKIFPAKINKNVSSVIVRDYQGNSTENTFFTDISWTNVTWLDFTVNGNVVFGLKRDNFIKLQNLTYLGIHAPRLKFIDRYLFRGLTNLKILDLSLSMYIIGKELVTSLMDGQLRLLSLNLSYISPAQPFPMDQNFMQTISETKTERLSFRGSNLLIKGPFNFTGLNLKLLYLDMSNSSIAMTDLSHKSLLNVYKHLTENLNEFHLSYIRSNFLEIGNVFLQHIQVTNCSRADSITFIFSKVQNAFLNGIFQLKVYANNSHIDMTACTTRMKSLHMKDNNFIYLNTTIKWPKRNYLKTMDLSGNHMEYLNPDFFNGLASLESIDLSYNKFFLMETFEDFFLMFKKFRELQYCNMSHNKLTFIPKHMFKNNAKMVKLDLSNNDLTSVAFDLDQFKVIQVLSLMNNRIKVLMEKDITRLNVLLQLHSANVPDVDFRGNPFECSCKSKQFFLWLSSVLQPRTKRIYMCQMDGQKHSIDKTVIEQVEYLCMRNTIIIVSVCGITGTLLIVVFSATFLLLRYKKKKRKQTMDNFLCDLRTDRFAEKYLCFLSFSSNEDQELIDEISGSIDWSLHDLTGKEENRVFVGDDFRLGHYIINEIFRVVNQSYVMVCLVSREFCASTWCEWELRIAFESCMPVILVFTEEVPQGEMPTLLHHVYNTQTRAKVLKIDGHYCWTPNCDRLCVSIVEHAFNRHVENNGL